MVDWASTCNFRSQLRRLCASKLSDVSTVNQPTTVAGKNKTESQKL